MPPEIEPRELQERPIAPGADAPGLLENYSLGRLQLSDLRGIFPSRSSAADNLFGQLTLFDGQGANGSQPQDSNPPGDRLALLSANVRTGGQPSDRAEMLRRSEQWSVEQRQTLSNLWGSGTPQTSIRPEAVVQGGLNNCFFLSSLASVAQAHPESIANMIEPIRGQDGRPIPGAYRVTFPGDRSNPVEVQLTPDDLRTYAGVGANGCWAAVLAKAYGTHVMRSDPRLTDPSQAFEGLRDAQGNVIRGAGGSTSDALQLLTNRPYRDLHLVATLPSPKGGTVVDFRPLAQDRNRTPQEAQRIEQEVLAVLRQVFPPAGPRESALVAFKAGEDDRNINNRRDDGLYSNHGYTVLGYRQDSQGTTWITLRNPHGNDRLQYGDRFEMTLSQFCQTFSRLSYTPTQQMPGRPRTELNR